MRLYHSNRRVPATHSEVYGIDTEKVEEGYAEFPAQTEESAGKNYHPRKHINHEIHKGTEYTLLTFRRLSATHPSGHSVEATEITP